MVRFRVREGLGEGLECKSVNVVEIIDNIQLMGTNNPKPNPNPNINPNPRPHPKSYSSPNFIP